MLGFITSIEFGIKMVFENTLYQKKVELKTVRLFYLFANLNW